MSDKRHFISIWFFIGVILVAYGILILGTGLWELAYPPARPVVLGHLRASIWWGGLILALGAVYCARFRPGRSQGPTKG